MALEYKKALVSQKSNIKLTFCAVGKIISRNQQAQLIFFMMVEWRRMYQKARRNKLSFLSSSFV
jgi:hypothetical protein